MSRRIIVEGADLVVIKKKKGWAGKPGKPGNSRETHEKKGTWFDIFRRRKPKTTEKPDKCLLLRHNILKEMETRAEAVFRPGHEDVEVIYALSGEDTLNKLHSFSSEEILCDSTSMKSNINIENLIKHIEAELGKLPGLLVILHTHPSDSKGDMDMPSSQLSMQDKVTLKSWTQTIKQHSPGTELYYGVHAIWRGAKPIRERTGYEKINENLIRWGSVTHDHEVGFYTARFKAIDVNIKD